MRRLWQNNSLYSIVLQLKNLHTYILQPFWAILMEWDDSFAWAFTSFLSLKVTKMKTCYLMLLVFCWDKTLFQLYRGSRWITSLQKKYPPLSCTCRQGYMCPPNHLPYDSGWFKVHPISAWTNMCSQSFQLRFWKILLPAHFALLETWISWVEPFGLKVWGDRTQTGEPSFFLGRGGNLRIFYFVACCLLFIHVLSFKFSSCSCGKN